MGARWFKYENDVTSGFALPLLDTVYFGEPQDAINVNYQSNDVDDNDAIFKFNTSYDFSDDIMGYLTISEGYRLGGINSVPPCVCSSGPEPERLRPARRRDVQARYHNEL